MDYQFHLRQAQVAEGELAKFFPNGQQPSSAAFSAMRDSLTRSLRYHSRMMELLNKRDNCYDRVRELDGEWIELERQAQELANAGKLAEATMLFNRSEDGPRFEARKLRLEAQCWDAEARKLEV